MFTFVLITSLAASFNCLIKFMSTMPFAHFLGNQGLSVFLVNDRRYVEQSSCQYLILGERQELLPKKQQTSVFVQDQSRRL